MLKNVVTEETLREAAAARVVRAAEGTDLGPAVCVIGAFDGVHQGHRYLIDAAKAEAAERGLPSCIITFDIDPDELFRAPSDVHKLTVNEDRIALLAALGTDYVLVLPFTRDFAAQEPRVFLDAVCAGFVQARGLHVGEGFRFGSRASGTVDTMREWAAARAAAGAPTGTAVGTDAATPAPAASRTDTACTVTSHDLLRVQTEDTVEPVTASRVRALLAEGDVEHAATCLTRPHFMRGFVERGRGVGSGLGIPTANIRIDEPYAQLGDGVYAGYLEVDGNVYRTAVSVGAPVTFGVEKRTVEAFLLDFEGDIYERPITVHFVKRLRGMRKFESVDALVAEINRNIAWVRENL